MWARSSSIGLALVGVGATVVVFSLDGLDIGSSRKIALGVLGAISIVAGFI